MLVVGGKDGARGDCNVRKVDSVTSSGAAVKVVTVVFQLN